MFSNTASLSCRKFTCCYQCGYMDSAM